ncbi:MAG: RsmE family RNA methyltransferase [Myxococcales bacterium]|nr:RsmE family RNA methyltransferase [Myxococcales bacterium]
MNLVLLEPEEVDASGAVVLRGRRARHLWEVLRVAPGRVLKVGVVRGSLGRAEVTRATAEEVVLAARFDESAPVTPELDVILAVPRPKVLSRVLVTLAAFGVRRIDLVNAWRVDKSFLGSSRLDEAALGAALRLGCEQGGTTWVPEVATRPLLVPFLDEVLAPRLAADGARGVLLLAHPGVPQTLESAVPAGTLGSSCVAIGPEGGWIAEERASFAQLGFVEVAIAPAILRVEAAAAALLGQLALWRRVGR